MLESGSTDPERGKSDTEDATNRQRWLEIVGDPESCRLRPSEVVTVGEGNFAVDDRWAGVRALLTTDPRDVGCEDTWQLIDVYAELVLAGEDPEQRFPGITVHLGSCDPCAEDYRGLLNVMRSAAGEAPGSSER